MSKIQTIKAVMGLELNRFIAVNVLNWVVIFSQRREFPLLLLAGGQVLYPTFHTSFSLNNSPPELKVR